MKIAVVGSHGVGKTTLAKGLSKVLKYPILPDIAREAFRKGFTINEKTPPENQLWILCKQMEYEKKLKDNFIADKTLFDNIVYSRKIFSDKYFLTLIEDIVRKIAKYDIYLYIPIEIPLKNDKVRSPDLNFQRMIDEEYTLLLKDLKVKYYEIRGSIPERIERSLKIINPKIILNP